MGKTYSPYTVTIDEAIKLIEEHDRKEAEKFISSFPEQDIEVLNGRFGAYIKHGGENYKLPKGTDAKALTLEECLEIIKNVKPSGGAKKRVTRGK